jgi:hypothetical protein
MKQHCSRTLKRWDLVWYDWIKRHHPHIGVMLSPGSGSVLTGLGWFSSEWFVKEGGHLMCLASSSCSWSPLCFFCHVVTKPGWLVQTVAPCYLDFPNTRIMSQNKCLIYIKYPASGFLLCSRNGNKTMPKRNLIITNQSISIALPTHWHWHSVSMDLPFRTFHTNGVIKHMPFVFHFLHVTKYFKSSAVV